MVERNAGVATTGASNSASASMSATSSSRTATSSATASTSPRGWKGSRTRRHLRSGARQETHVGKTGMNRFEDIGEQALKNIARPIRAYRMQSRATWHGSKRAVAARAARQAVACVLPFQNMSGDPEQDYFADGIVEDIITALSRFKSFAVIARNSTFVYKGRAVDVRQVARELGVRYVLEGSVRRAGERLRITAQLVDGVTGAHLWARNFEVRWRMYSTFRTGSPRALRRWSSHKFRRRRSNAHDGNGREAWRPTTSTCGR